MTSSLTIFAPAKINLYLRVTGRRPDHYHTLDSLINFADIGDDILIEQADKFSFEINGPFAPSFPDDATKSDHESTNLVVRTVFALSKKLEKLPDFKITLTKNLPVASGIGGGSSNAAATIWGLQEWWGLPSDLDFLPALFLELGADVPVCYFSQPARVRGIGDVVEPVADMPEMAVVLVNPNIECSTQAVFSLYNSPFSQPVTLPPDIADFDTCIAFLQGQKNDLTSAAARIVPSINQILSLLSAQKGCYFSRLSGSGATCFGLFDGDIPAQSAAKKLAQAHPDWWIASGTLNRIERY